ncbi:hypothetical protein CCO03_02470 [Comamonas serinivorans]|uniref:Molybdopterin synthase sulfur carrier subunit n=1 Tax=Comamonas serinivorans TaxID=1082851 RepID=A0A1Y0EJR2_9BURK|nr:MoaD/ThiS family protein [Comamonas serinivorans]ARU03700.1 hypothetical protein CCO03_02470 [Comamonas serinivorans]
MSDTITVLFFGPLKTLVPSGSEALPWTAGDTDDLLQLLRARGPEWAAALHPRALRLALNRQLLHTAAPIRPGDEVGLVPPVTGG